MPGEGEPAQAAPRYGRWQALWFGLPLGALALGILALAVKFPARVSPGPAILLGLALYFIIPLIAGYCYCYQQRHEGCESGWAGFRVGLVSAALFMLVLTVLLVISAYVSENTPPPPNLTPLRRPFHSQTLDIIIGSVIFGIFVTLNWAGVLLSAAGARIGGALAIWRAKSQLPKQPVQEAQA